MNGGIDPSFWRGRRVMVTGHTGFKGGWLSLMLAEMGAEVLGYALDPEARPNLFEAAQVGRACRSVIADIRDAGRLSAATADFAPEVAFHLAAQPLVRRSYREPLATFETNVMGTANLLEACRAAGSVRVVVAIATDKVYGGAAPPQGFAETAPLGGHDPYSASKAAAELVADSWRASFLAQAGIALATARAGNVIGGGDWAEDRILPDAIRAFEAGRPLRLRNPDSVRPWQHVFDPLRGYLLLAQACWAEPTRFARAWNFGPDLKQCLPVREMADLAAAAWGEGASWEAAVEADAPRETGILLLDSSAARRELGWAPRLSAAEAVAAVMDWHKRQELPAFSRAAALAALDREAA